jgi:hypothetical protein
MRREYFDLRSFLLTTFSGEGKHSIANILTFNIYYLIRQSVAVPWLGSWKFESGPLPIPKRTPQAIGVCSIFGVIYSSVSSIFHVLLKTIL